MFNLVEALQNLAVNVTSFGALTIVHTTLWANFRNNITQQKSPITKNGLKSVEL